MPSANRQTCYGPQQFCDGVSACSSVARGLTGVDEDRCGTFVEKLKTSMIEFMRLCHFQEKIVSFDTSVKIFVFSG